MCQRNLRLNSLFSRDAITVLSDGNIGAATLLMKLESEHPEDIIAIFAHLDSKHLYGSRLYELFVRVCDGDVDRFLYHLEMELPCQLCGGMFFVGSHMETMTDEQLQAHGDARTAGQPDSFWALESPPENPDYEYPVVAEVAAS